MTHPERLDGLYQLLPPVYRDRDAAENFPLRDLLRMVSEQVRAIEHDAAQLYDGWFIETCADWVVPYIGDLIGYQAVREAGEASTAGALGRVLTLRREVVNTIRFRRRKGTLAVLEELSRAIAGWPARAAEYDPARGLLDVRGAAALDLLGSPFDTQPHLIDVRRPDSELSPGRVNPLDVILSVWRLRVFSVTRTRVYHLTGLVSCFRFSFLGNDAPLFTKPLPEEDPAQLAGELHVPGPIRRRALRERVDAPGDKEAWAAPAEYYGADRSLAIYAPDWPHKGAPQPIPRERILSADLHGWPEPPHGRVYVDPVRGRLRFPSKQPPHHLQVSYHYGQPAPLGGGEYAREVSEPAGVVLYPVGKGGDIANALDLWKTERPVHAIIEITHSGYYSTVFEAALPAGHSLQIRAARGVRPILEFDEKSSRSSGHGFFFSGEPGSRLTLDGLLVIGCGVVISGPHGGMAPAAGDCPFEVLIRHCTLVPGWSFDHGCHDDDGNPCEHAMHAPEKASLKLDAVNGRVTIEHSILGTILVEQNAVTTDPLDLILRDSIVDCAHEGEGPHSDTDPAYITHHAIHSSACSQLAHATLRLARCTIFGWVKVHAILSADDCIFGDRVLVARRQLGCLRFCSLPPDSRTPRRYQCQPDRALRALDAASSTPPSPTTQERERQRVVPHWMTRRFGQPDYARLARTCALEIARGAEDESEMGVFHDLYEPQRADNLRARLAEFVPADTEAGISFVT